ncbi:RidA family protein [Streptomyces boluensis]|uniref:RidA family protein n=1 Tax=Streptomyces boluensis TaxID=1775135 RepID=A0A964UQ60_9ACTN|nr:Rid family detoxifying hydrolase [Streptomyces boluensis]NBE52752.1 RidA family protein [Streptomyces boluensis]
MTREEISTDEIAKPVGPFSAAVRADGFTFVSGQVAQDPATGALIDGDVSAQTEQVFLNVSAVLAAAGKTLDDVVRVGVYLTDMADFAAVNAVYGEVFSAPYPARTAIGVAALPLGAAVEVDVIVG